MPTFSFIATDQNGSVVNGARVAGSRQELIARLRSESMVVTAVTEEAGTEESPQFARWRIFFENLTRGRIRQIDLMVVTRQLAAMLKAGVSLTDALHTIAHSVEQPRLHNILLQVRTDVQRGRSLSEALRRHPAAFEICSSASSTPARPAEASPRTSRAFPSTSNAANPSARSSRAPPPTRSSSSSSSPS